MSRADEAVTRAPVVLPVVAPPVVAVGAACSEAVPAASLPQAHLGDPR